MKLVELFPDLPTLELAGRTRHLHFGVLALGQLEHLYGDITAAYQAASRVISGHVHTPEGLRPVPMLDDLTQVLWACLLEDAEDHGETLLIPTVRRALHLDQVATYKELIAQAVAMASPAPGTDGTDLGLGGGDGR